jgi:hypothetical protein
MDTRAILLIILGVIGLALGIFGGMSLRLVLHVGEHQDPFTLLLLQQPEEKAEFFLSCHMIQHLLTPSAVTRSGATATIVGLFMDSYANSKTC